MTGDRHALTVYLNRDEHEYLRDRAGAWTTSMSGALRRLLRELRQGWPDPESSPPRFPGVVPDTGSILRDLPAAYGNRPGVGVPTGDRDLSGSRLLAQVRADLHATAPTDRPPGLGALIARFPPSP